MRLAGAMTQVGERRGKLQKLVLEGVDARREEVVEGLLKGLERAGDRLLHFRTRVLAEIFDAGHDDGFDLGGEGGDL
ncbi:MAG: hypothetical protein ABSG41_19395, partial [Bryobacteraceae bacterium]